MKLSSASVRRSRAKLHQAAAIAELRALLSMANDLAEEAPYQAAILESAVEHGVRALSLIDPHADDFLDAEAGRVPVTSPRVALADIVF